jgi:outer membrane lipoprotein-sorting protein
MKPSLTSRALLAIVLLCGMAASAEAQKFSSGHWKSKTVMEGGPQGPATAEGEVWLKNDKVRMKSQMMGMNSNMLVAEDAIYQWMEGQPMGMKLPKDTESSASADYVNMDLRTKGKKIGTETVDGLVCDVYVLETSRGGRKATHTGWLARAKSGFPVKWVMESGKTKTTTTNRDIEIGANVPDSMVTLPKDVRFEDMSEMMKSMPRQ